MCADQDVQPFAGELFLTLAAEGRLERAVEELPKYIEALRLARRT